MRRRNANILVMMTTLAMSAMSAMSAMLACSGLLLVAADVVMAEEKTAAQAQSPQGLRLQGHGGPIRSVTLSQDGRSALTSSFDYSGIYWRLADGGGGGDIVHRLIGHDAAVNDLVFVPGQAQAFSVSDDGTAALWDLNNGTLLHRFAKAEGKLLDAAVAPDGRLAVAVSWDHSARLYDLTAPRQLAVLKGHRGPVNAAAFTPAGDGFVTAGYDGTLRLWQADTSNAHRLLHKHGWGINVLAFLDHDMLVFGAADGAVTGLDITSGRLQPIFQSERPILSLALSADTAYLAVGGGDGYIRVFDTESWVLQEEVENLYGPVWAMAFLPGGDRLLHAGLDDFVASWQVAPRQAFDAPQGTFPRRFQIRQGSDPGELQFLRKCSICHTLVADDAHRAGPTLYGIFGRKAGSLPGYPYSQALKDSNIVWNAKTIAALFDDGPHEVTPGSKMPLQRITDPVKRAALIAYLKTATAVRTPLAKD